MAGLTPAILFIGEHFRNRVFGVAIRKQSEQAVKVIPLNKQGNRIVPLWAEQVRACKRGQETAIN